MNLSDHRNWIDADLILHAKPSVTLASGVPAGLTGIAQLRELVKLHLRALPHRGATRRWLAADLKDRLAGDSHLEEAAMERRPGAQYDFNGELLIEVLRRLAREDDLSPLFVLPVFLFAGRHAGPGGDLAEISATVQGEFPTLAIHLTGLVGDHPGLIHILAARYREASQRESL